MKRKLLLPALLAVAIPAIHADDFGLGLSVGASHKFNKKLTLSAEGEMRTRNDFRTMDRWSIGADASYRIFKFLKASGGYTLLYDNNPEKVSRSAEGEVTKWTPSYWGVRHRFNISLTGSVSVSRFTFSLRERWQYTYRPRTTTDRYDFSDGCWTDKTVSSSGKNVLRSRLQAEYDIPRCKVDPYVSVELFNSMALQKTRFIAGAEWRISKKQSLAFQYRYQIVSSGSSSEVNGHLIGASYKFKF